MRSQFSRPGNPRNKTYVAAGLGIFQYDRIGYFFALWQCVAREKGSLRALIRRVGTLIYRSQGLLLERIQYLRHLEIHGSVRYKDYRFHGTSKWLVPHARPTSSHVWLVSPGHFSFHRSKKIARVYLFVPTVVELSRQRSGGPRRQRPPLPINDFRSSRSLLTKPL